MNDYSQLGIAGLTLGILFFIVRWFVDTITKKDEQISIITENFTKVMSNHIVHETKARVKETKMLGKLVTVITKLDKKLDK